MRKPSGRCGRFRGGPGAGTLKRHDNAAALLALIALAPALACAAADAAAPPADYAQLSAPLSCADFERRDETSWTPQRPFEIEGVYRGIKFRSTYGINTVIRKGTVIDGLDLATLLAQACPAH